MLTDGMSIQRAAALGAAFAHEMPAFVEQQKQKVAASQLSPLELDLSGRVGMTAADYLEAKKASAENRPIDGS